MKTITPLNWSSIDTVFLDMDGTLLDLHFDNYFWQDYLFEQYAKKNGISKAEVETELEAHYQSIHGSLNWYCTDYWERTLDIDIIALKQDIQHLIRYRADAEVFLKTLRKQDVQVILITNAHPNSLNLKLSLTTLGTYFDQLISAHQFGFPKEQSDFWARLKQDVSFDIKNSLFIDDNDSVLSSAQDFGIKHLYNIIQPDSTKPARSGLDFPAIDQFKDLFES